MRWASASAPGGGGGGRGGRGGRGGGGGGGAAGQLTFSVEAKRDTLPQALELLGEILREPAFPAEEFETSKRRMASMLSAGRTEPARPGPKQAQPRPVALLEGRRALRADARGNARPHQARHARTDQDALRNADRRLARRAGRRRRLRPGEHAAAREGDARRLGIEGAVQADRPQGGRQWDRD